MSGVDPVGHALMRNCEKAANRTKAVAFVDHPQAQVTPCRPLCGIGALKLVEGRVAFARFALVALCAAVVQAALDQMIMLTVGTLHGTQSMPSLPA